MLVVITAGSVTASSLDNYTSNFKFNTVSNGYGILKAKIGLLTYDEAVHARGGYPFINTQNYMSTELYNTIKKDIVKDTISFLIFI